MKGGIMRDQTRNIETFKVGTGAHLNEFDFHKHQGEMHEHHVDEHERGAATVQTKAERVAEVMKKAHEKAMRRRKKH
jgi:hypothetical protein